VPCRSERALSFARGRVSSSALCHSLSLRVALARLGISEGRAHVHVKLVSCLLSAVCSDVDNSRLTLQESGGGIYAIHLPASLGPHLASSRIQHIVVFTIIAQPPTTALTIIVSHSLPAIVPLSPYSRCIAHWHAMHATASITDNLPPSALAAPLISVGFHHPPASAA
jgi:hypothetical protein